VEPVEEEGEELLRVVLGVAGKLGCKVADGPLEIARAERRVLARPDCLDELTILGGDFALHTQRV